MATSLDELAAHSSRAGIELARSVLEQDIADRAWGAQVGPALSQVDVGRLLGKSPQAVSKDPRLLRVRNRDGRPVYPVVQFDGRGLLPGIADVLAILAGMVEPLTVASWLTAPNRSLDGRRPVDALRDGDLVGVRTVAHRLARRAGS